MELITTEDFAELANYKSDHCISIYIPTHSSGVEVNEKHDPILFKNKLQEARMQLTNKGFDITSIEKMLKPAADLLKDDIFWKNQSKGLVAFLSNTISKIIKLPIPVKEELFINNSFLLTPILPVMYKKHRFYLLRLSKHDVKLYEGNQFGMNELTVEGFTKDVDITHFRNKERMQAHRRANVGGQRPIADSSFHGSSGDLIDEDVYVSQYFREIDEILRTEILHNQHVPLVLAAVDYETALYKQTSNYKHIYETSLIGNFEHEDKNSLYLKAKEILTPYFKEYTNKALKAYYDYSAKALTSSIPEDVITASYYAQVSDLFVKENAHIWGTFNETDSKVEIHDEPQEGDVCLVNSAIIQTLISGGEVHILEKQKMPADSKLAAFLRFSL